MLLRENICWKCQNWENCFKYRYGNARQEYMKKISKVKDSWGETVIYVSKCDRYKVENPDIPRLMSTDLQKKNN